MSRAMTTTRPCAKLLALLVAAGIGGLGAAALAADEPGGRDHPLIGRYQGSTIVFYKAAEFDEAALLKAPHDYGALLDRDATKDRSGPEWLRTEGRVTKIRYEIPTGRSSLEVMRNYESALKAKGFEVVFACVDQACFRGKLKDPYLLGEQLDPDNGVSTLYFDRARYMLAKLSRPQGAVYAAVLTGDSQERVTTFVSVVEEKAMEGDKIATIDSGQIEKALGADGRVSIYGILFDYDKDVVRPESKPALIEIAKALSANPTLRVEIVGHTDNRGAADYNLDLSRRRAANVAAALTREHGVAAGRLTSSGAGLGAPVASNDTEEGRARNRRVELIAR